MRGGGGSVSVLTRPPGGSREGEGRNPSGARKQVSWPARSLTSAFPHSSPPRPPSLKICLALSSDTSQAFACEPLGCGDRWSAAPLCFGEKTEKPTWGVSKKGIVMGTGGDTKRFPENQSSPPRSLYRSRRRI